MKDITYAPCEHFDVKSGHPMISCPDADSDGCLASGACSWYQDNLTEHEANYDVHGPCKRKPKEDTQTVDMFKDEEV
jgi:uncharacterized protein YodC (DUF2158 family)